MLRVIATYTLCFCGGYGSGTIIREGFDEEKPWKIVIGLILAPLSIIGAGFAGQHAFDDCLEEDE